MGSDTPKWFLTDACLCNLFSNTPPPPNLGSLIQYLPVISAGDIFLMCNLHLPCYEFAMDAEEGHTQLHLGGLFKFLLKGVRVQMDSCKIIFSHVQDRSLQACSSHVSIKMSRREMFAYAHFGEDLETDSIWLCLLTFPLCFTFMYLPLLFIPSPLLEKPGKLTLHWWQQLPWAHSAPSFRVQLLALQQGLLHSWKTARCNSLQGRCSRQE